MAGGADGGSSKKEHRNCNRNSDACGCSSSEEAPTCPGPAAPAPSGHPWPESGPCAIHGALSAAPGQDAASWFGGCGVVVSLVGGALPARIHTLFVGAT